MNRIIKFRGKRTDTNKWIYGDLLTLNGTECEISDWDDVVYSRYDVDADTVGQFTGLPDKNGREIYEGDLSQDKLGRISVCEFHHGGYWIRTIETSYSERLHNGSQMDIIGNVHDNPELLKGGKE